MATDRRARRALRRQMRRRDERGFTLIELVVTLTLITFAIVGSMQVFYGGMRLTLAANSRTKATAQATLEVETMRSVPYGDVGMDETQLAGATTFSDRGVDYTYVTGGTTQPTSTTTVGTTTYTITRSIVWIAVGPNNQAYKRVTAWVAWRDQGGNHSIRQDSFVYPGGLGPYVTTTTTTTLIPTTTTTAAPTTTTTAGAGTTTTTTAPGLSAPISLTATDNAATPDSQIDLSWTPGAVNGTTWEIQHDTNSAFSSYSVDTTTQPVGTTTFSKTGLAATTTFYFRVRAVNASGVGPWSPTATASTTTPPVVACAVGTSNVTPSAVNKASNNKWLSTSLNVTLHTTGACSGLLLKFKPSSSLGNVTVALSPSGGNVWSTTIAATTYTWDVGNKSLTVTDGSNTLATIALLVCAKGSHCP